jgi:microcompartment protein CcmL/EutN
MTTRSLLAVPLISKGQVLGVIEAVNKTEGATVETWVIIPRPHENVVAVLPIAYTDDVETYRLQAEGIVPLATNRP